MTKEMFFDADCLSAFLWINETNILQELYGGRIVLPEPVYLELSHPSIEHLKKRADALIDCNDASVKPIEVGTEEYALYSELIGRKKGRKSIGRGEAGSIALAKTYRGILASNNYKDISPYIEEYGLKHTDSGKILVQALDKGLITEDDGNDIWKRMLAKKRLLPTNTFSEYIQKNK